MQHHQTISHGYLPAGNAARRGATARVTRSHEPLVVMALSGEQVVYLAADDRWTRRLAEAEVLTDEAHAQIRLIEAAVQAEDVAGVRLAPAGA